MEKIIRHLRNPQVWGFFVSIVIMAVISLAFFWPDAVDGSSLQQADMQQGMANGHEAQQWQEQTGEKALWTNSLFGGMPTFQISPEYPSNALFTWLNTVYGLGLPAPANLMFMMMFGFLILLFAMRMRWYYALLGAVAWGFSSYFVIIIGAGHIWKFVALSYVPPTIAGMMLCYRGRYVVGAALLSLFAMLQLNANHPQMSYYFFFVMLALAIAWFVEAYKEHKLRRWLTASVVTIAAGGLAVGANLPSLYNTYEYSKETKRSQSELTPLGADLAGADVRKPTGGMPYEQIVGWSYGRAESFSLLIPNIKGGATARPEQGRMVGMGLDLLPDADRYNNTSGGELLPYLSQYFNNSEGTNGPVYVGAIICALFLLGCIIVKGPVKWALLVMTVISLLLSWGSNFEWLTDLMIYNMPLYNKFRAVESILVIAEFTMPLLAVMGLHTLLTTPDGARIYRKPVLWAFGVPAAICLVAWIMPSLFGEAITDTDRAMVSNIQQQIVAIYGDRGASSQQLQAMLYQYSLTNPDAVKAIESLRYGMVSADALRSLIFLLLGLGMLWIWMMGKCRAVVAVVGLGALVLCDLFGVDKRYVSHSSFCDPVKSAAPQFEPDAIDRAILADTAQSYRVLDIPGFSMPDRSYFHKMIGGYHAAKLNRYEDLIQRRIIPAIRYGFNPADSASRSTLDMLNAKYIITGDSNAPVVVNTHALGNAWLVEGVDYVMGADAEMAALGKIDPARRAVADIRFSGILGNDESPVAQGDTIYLVDYTPNRLTYHVDTRAGGLAVFSEVWFPWGWHATIDGNEVPLGRVNYVLRALRVPAGEHTVVMTFDPQSIHTTSSVAYACVTLIYLLCAAGIFVAVQCAKRRDDGLA